MFGGDAVSEDAETVPNKSRMAEVKALEGARGKAKSRTTYLGLRE